MTATSCRISFSSWPELQCYTSAHHLPRECRHLHNWQYWVLHVFRQLLFVGWPEKQSFTYAVHEWAAKFNTQWKTNPWWMYVQCNWFVYM